MVISYIIYNNANLPWVAWVIVFELSLDLGKRFSFFATMMGSNHNSISARGCTA